MQNGNNRNSKTINSIIIELYRRRDIDSGNNVGSKNRKTARADDRLYNRK